MNDATDPNFDDQPTVALLDAPLHAMSAEELNAYVAALRERRTNVAKTRATNKASSDKLEGKAPKKPQMSFNPNDLLL
tara:strand:+ start:1085 stop:1318 length:234 start_codon:yes stop_codon:yes gene_type:complete